MLNPFSIRVTSRDKKRFKKHYRSRPYKDDSQSKLFRDMIDAYEREQKSGKEIEQQLHNLAEGKTHPGIGESA